MNHNTADYLDIIDELTCGSGVDIILEMLANINLDKDLKLFAKFGRVVVIGTRGTIEIDPRDMLWENAAILSMSLFNVDQKKLQQIHYAIKAGLADDRYKPVISSELIFADAAKAHKLVMQTGVNGKIILVP